MRPLPASRTALMGVSSTAKVVDCGTCPSYAAAIGAGNPAARCTHCVKVARESCTPASARRWYVTARALRQTMRHVLADHSMLTDIGRYRHRDRHHRRRAVIGFDRNR